MKYYVLCPGYAYSPNDGDQHYITWQALQRLYQLQRHEFSVKRGTTQHPVYDPPLPEGKEIMYLRPSDLGHKYGRPE